MNYAAKILVECLGYLKPMVSKLRKEVDAETKILEAKKHRLAYLEETQQEAIKVVKQLRDLEKAERG